MKSVDAIKIMAAQDRQGTYIWHLDGLGELFGEEGDRLRGTVRRLVADEVLGRVMNGIYYNRLSHSIGLNTLYDFARAMRPDGPLYESFESAASQWGIISQVPWRLTFATQGSGGEYHTPWGPSSSPTRAGPTKRSSGTPPNGRTGGAASRATPSLWMTCCAITEASTLSTGKRSTTRSVSTGSPHERRGHGRIRYRHSHEHGTSQTGARKGSHPVRGAVVPGRRGAPRPHDVPRGHVPAPLLRIPRFSEDLDFTAGERFDELPWDSLARDMGGRLSERFGTDVRVKEPRLKRFNDGGTSMARWTVSVDTAPERLDMPFQRLKIEVASVPSHTSEMRRVATVLEPERPASPTVACQSLVEIAADKLVSFADTERYIRYRDLWDLPWIAAQGASDRDLMSSLVRMKHGGIAARTIWTSSCTRGVRGRGRPLRAKISRPR